MVAQVTMTMTVTAMAYIQHAASVGDHRQTSGQLDGLARFRTMPAGNGLPRGCCVLPSLSRRPTRGWSCFAC